MEPLLSSAQPAPTGLVKDSNTASFRADVIDASKTVPVIVDFWAPWCGPCKTLGPQIEKAVKAARGKVRLVKVDIDQNQQLAAQLRVQSIPAVFAFYQGRPVDGFVGAIPESQIKAFIDRLAKLAQGGPGAEADGIAEALAEAAQALEEKDFATAGAIYNQILQHDPENAPAIAGLMRSLIGVGRTADAKQMLETLPESAAKSPEVAGVRRQLELAEQAAGLKGKTGALEKRLAADPADHQARFDLALAHYAAGDAAAAIDGLLEIVRRDRTWNEQAARQQLVKIFEALGPTSKLTQGGRRRLSSLLFS